MPALLLALLLTLLAPASLVEQVSEKRLRQSLEKLVAFETRNSFSDTSAKGRGIGAARLWLKAELERIAGASKGAMTVGVQRFMARDRRSNRRQEQQNVYARLEGTKHPKSVIVFGAHYDSLNLRSRDPDARAPGANDNGSGTVAVLEAARLFAAHEWDRTLIFVAFSAEEQGLLGSRAFARYLKSEGLAVWAMLNNDIVGGVTNAKAGANTRSIRCFADPRHAPSVGLARLTHSIAQLQFKSSFQVLIQNSRDRPGRGGDHMSFNREGYPAVRLIETHENLAHQHNATDLIEHISFPYLTRAVKLDVALLATLANAPPTPTGLSVSRRGDSLLLTWEAVAGARGYRVGLREKELTFVRVIDCEKPRLEIPRAGSGLTFSVAARGREGALSLFSAERGARRGKLYSRLE